MFLLADTEDILDAISGQTEAEQAVEGEGREPPREDPEDDPVPNQ